jgi:hypothetical protein
MNKFTICFLFKLTYNIYEFDVNLRMHSLSFSNIISIR